MHLRKPTIHSFAFVVLFSLSVSVVVGADDGRAKKFDGKIINGVYHHPQGWFTIKVPKLLQPGAVKQSSFESEAGTLQFSDDLGTFIRVDATKATDPRMLSLLNSPDWQAVLIQNRKFMAYLYSMGVKGVELSHQQYLTNNNERIDFFVFFLPNGSTIENSVTKRRLDAFRSSISFVTNNILFTISSQNNPILGMTTNATEALSAMKKDLLDTKATMTFPKQ